jgi:hypothetical protein
LPDLFVQGFKAGVEFIPELSVFEAPVNYRKQGFQEAVLFQPEKNVLGAAALKDLKNLLGKPGMGAPGQFRGKPLDGPHHGQGKGTVRNNPVLDRPEEPHRVFHKGFVEIDDGMEPSLLYVPKAPGIIDELFLQGAVVKGVNRKIPPPDILLKFAVNGIGILLGGAVLGPEGGNLDDLFSKKNVYQPETAAYDPGVSKKLPDGLGQGVGGNVKILGGAAQEKVPNRPPHDVGLVSGGLKAADNFYPIPVNQIRVNPVLLPGVDFGHRLKGPAGRLASVTN